MYYDIIIIGGGSSGVGACLAASDTNPDASILLVERETILGGTSTVGGVHNWEPGVSTGRYHVEIAKRLLESGKGCVAKDVWHMTPEKPMGISEPCSDSYERTRRRAGVDSWDQRRFHFEPLAMDRVMKDMISDRKNVTLLLNTEFVRSRTEKRKIKELVLKQDSREFTVSGQVYIDASADIYLARDAGCGWNLGREASSEYGEPSAPEEHENYLNACSLIFRIQKKDESDVDPIPSPYDSIDVSDWAKENLPNNRPVSFVTQYPNGDYCINMLPTIEGRVLFDMEYGKGYELCKARVYRYFKWLQEEKGFAGYRLISFAPRIGIRETYRLKARHVLTENEVRMPFGEQPLSDEIIVYADHAIDVHGKKHSSNDDQNLKYPYGIPYSCLLPVERDNLLVSCRGSGFTHIVGASCRLSRTMMAIGEAAGTAAAICLKDGCNPPEVDVSKVCGQMDMEYVKNNICELFGI
ncbi:MAG TPA: FAD-dependent oxidoreductase [Clostridiales bacterium]|nr:FAD-dependent oxidoreductase [Clostridiales bacterium]